MRLYRVSAQDVETTIAHPVSRDRDVRRNTRLVGQTADGRPILVVVAGDKPDFVITVSPLR